MTSNMQQDGTNFSKLFKSTGTQNNYLLWSLKNTTKITIWTWAITTWPQHLYFMWLFKTNSHKFFDLTKRWDLFPLSLDLSGAVSHYWLIECRRSDFEWLSKQGQKWLCSFHLVYWNTRSPEPPCWWSDYSETNIQKGCVEVLSGHPSWLPRKQLPSTVFPVNELSGTICLIEPSYKCSPAINWL